MSYLVLMEVHWKEIGILTSLASGARQAEERRLVGGLFAPSLGPQLSPRAGFEPPKRLSLPQVSYWGGPRLAGPQVLDTTILVSKLTGLRAGSVHSLEISAQCSTQSVWAPRSTVFSTRRSSEIEMKRGDRSSAPDLR
ncbi:hypothetical protein Acr_00g0000680 [Actinidia rufa]|uniref:Uncharacterized protein n=1 Tax=Actinidia rufa TaxID=165716 RepID=A0A7J0D6C2_9ERIC|nr:hypothetical protein Acr_00g0000680 [Actinidia rufa]